MENSRIAFIVPWFGRLPNYFEVWLKSCEWNKSIDFFLFTDDRSLFDYPSNVYVKYISFEEMRCKLQSVFPFKICLESPYKLCDYKPAYGEVFQDVLNGYDYWGFCDIDIIWGDIRSFISSSLLHQYSRLYTHGHCSIFKNEKEINCLYRTLSTSKYQFWKSVYQTNESRCFDEWGGHCGGGISYIFEENNIPTYNEIDFADLNYRKGAFKVNFLKEFQEDTNDYFMFSKGTLSLCEDGIEKRRFLYTHFQKRKIKICADIEDEFYFVAPGIIVNDYEEAIKKRGGEKRLYELKYYSKKIIGKFKKTF